MTFTPSQTVGPFFSFGLLVGRGLGPELVPRGSPGSLVLRGQVLDGEGAPVPDALVEAWDAGARRFGRSGTEDGGWFELVTAKPAPLDGQAPHLALAVFARGLLKQLVTRVYFPGEPANASDPVLSELDPEARATLVARDAGDHLRFDIRLQGEGETTFFAL
jgi:protocatechuate 3,4-dioxygenase alpha subunit